MRQSRRRYPLPRLDPFRGNISLFIWTIHGKYRDHPLLTHPPYAKAIARKISTMYDLIRTRRIAPILVGEIEHVGKEIRDMPERSLVSHKRPGTILPL